MLIRAAPRFSALRRQVFPTSGHALRRLHLVVPETPSNPIPNEGNLTPDVVTSEIPGPRSLELKKELEESQECSAVHFFANYTKSYGNYIVDADGNRLLDCFGQIGSLPLGYNHPSITAMLQNPKNTWIMANRPALGVLPPVEWGAQLQDMLRKIAPKGMTDVTTMACGSTSVENAFKVCFIKYMDLQRGGAKPTQEELNSCMLNQEPGCPKLSILSFSGAFHGRTFGCLAATRSKPIHKLDIPHFDWPMARFPQLKYPLEEFEEYNKQEEADCLALVAKIIDDAKDGPQPVAGMIIEPIQAEGGDNHASPDFFRKLRNMSKEKNVYFIVDEVQTGGGATGKFWAHSHWNLDSPPDIVTFAKKTQIAGFFATKEMRPKEGYRIFNTWMGDPAKMLMLETVLKEYAYNDLVENAKITGDFLLDGLKQMEEEHKHIMGRARGIGTFCAVSLINTQTRDSVVYDLRQRGVQVGGCGAYTIRLRPNLLFLPQHAAEFLRIFNEVISATEVQGEVSEWNMHDPRNIVDVETGQQGKFHRLGKPSAEVLL